MPPAKPDYGQWDVPPRLKKDIDDANNVFYGKKGADWKMNKYRICWYVVPAKSPAQPNPSQH